MPPAADRQKSSALAVDEATTAISQERDLVVDLPGNFTKMESLQGLVKVVCCFEQFAEAFNAILDRLYRDKVVVKYKIPDPVSDLARYT